ncbi:heavy metal translocating P-type ATPase [Paracoccus sp. YLB-12]|uniref:Heavy metal translocating P-type ATPase n=1 Tax=Paracoccus maritimus TaxID=2933292 RepID=A0ABT2KAT5_9RHOB|nr:heavy metal translocating P-type ATPase [Paracoccus sp. YLB-12]MCT4333630.1 heavy metal translocating P-type ATPase [Paracoccus sp. YLB-12]
MTTHTNIDLAIPGINCASCAGRVERALKGLGGLQDIAVSPVTKRAHMRLDGTTLPQIDAVLTQAGYPPELTTTTLDVAGMSCASCANRVQHALSARPDVVSASVNLLTNSASVTHAPGLDPAELVQTVTRSGYAAKPPDGRTTPDAHRDEALTLRDDFHLALMLTLPVFIAEMGGHVFPGFHRWLMGLAGTTPLWLAEMLLTAVVLAVPGRRFFTIGVPALLRGRPEMNSLVALGAGAAFLFSSVVTLAPQFVPAASRHVYFEAAAVIVTLILMGRWLEARAKGQAGEAIKRLVELAPDQATLIRDGRDMQVAVSNLLPGDLVRLAPGERVAVDGQITEGHGHIDESMLTGEPVPAEKAPGDPVTGGTVNGMSALTYRVTATGKDTALSRIVAMVETAQAAKLPVQALVDRITRIFVPAVMSLAALAFALWLAFGPGLAEAVVAGVAVLIIACPCAMGLAVPVSIMVGTGRGAELGVLFRRGEALQRMAEADRIAFDKTGTLTLGRPTLTRIVTAGISENDALRLAAAAEARSEHPLAAAIMSAATVRGLDLPDAQLAKTTAGRGLTARADGRDLLIGNLDALREAGVPADPALVDAADRAAADGGTPAHLAIDGVHRACFLLADPERPEAAQTIAELGHMGLRCAMLSGDLQATADTVARRLGMVEAQGGLRPDDKLEAIERMGPRTIFVGDGINDAPALAAAGTGIAIGSGTDIAIESADAVLMSGDTSGVVRAIRLARAVMRNIRQNLFWAFAYNIALIPVAMGVLVPFGGPALSPMLGAGAMALSSVFVVGNALRLRRAT